MDFLAEKNIDAFFTSKQEDVFWLTGFWSSDAKCIKSANKIILFASPLDIKSAKKTCKNEISIKLLSKDNLKDEFKKIGQIGIDPMNIKLCELDSIKKFSPKIKIKKCENFISNLRIIKNNHEIDLIQKSAKITDHALAVCKKLIRKGISEKELAWKLEQAGREKGAEKKSFDFIVAFGKNSAIPHHQSGEAKLKENMAVLIDLGFKFDHYCSDLSRSFFYGKPKEIWLETYKHVLNAQNEAISKISQNVKVSEIHQAALNEFKKNNIDQYFIHSTGHGLGLEIHELPGINQVQKDTLQNNMVFTIEPGIYYSENFGIRIEDLFVLKKNKPVQLSRSPKNIKEVVLS